MSHFASIVAGLGMLVSCRDDGHVCPPTSRGDLLLPGAFVAENLGCVRGCEDIGFGEVVTSIDGTAVRGPADVDAQDLADGRPHRLELRTFDCRTGHTVELVARPADGPPFVLGLPAALDTAPRWARRRLFGHPSPIVQLVGLDGERIDGHSVVGRARLFVYWDHADHAEEAAAISFMQVLQKAQSDLLARDVDIAFAQVRFPQGRRAPMTNDDLLRWTERWSIEVDGVDLEMLPRFRTPDSSQHDPRHDLGLSRTTRLLENLGESPAIVILDERGIVRWHSEGLQPPDADAPVQDPAQYTIIEAVKFALVRL